MKKPTEFKCPDCESTFRTQKDCVEHRSGHHFYAITNPDGAITPNWVEGQKEIVCSVELLKQMIDQHNKSIAYREKLVEAVEKRVGWRVVAGFGIESDDKGELVFRKSMLEILDSVLPGPLKPNG